MPKSRSSEPNGSSHPSDRGRNGETHRKPNITDEDVEDANWTAHALVALMHSMRDVNFRQINTVNQVYDAVFDRDAEIKRLNHFIAEERERVDEELEAFRTDNQQLFSECKSFQAENEALKAEKQEGEKKLQEKIEAVQLKAFQDVEKAKEDAERSMHKTIKENDEKREKQLKTLKAEKKINADRAEKAENDKRELSAALGDENNRLRAELERLQSSLDCEKDGYRDKIGKLELELRVYSDGLAAQKQPAEAYANAFNSIENLIRGFAEENFGSLPEEEPQLDDISARFDTEIFQPWLPYKLLDCTYPAACFLRVSAVQSYVADKVTSFIQRLFFLEYKPYHQDGEKLLEAITEQLQNSNSISADAWRTSTVKALDSFDVSGLDSIRDGLVQDIRHDLDRILFTNLDTAVLDLQNIAQAAVNIRQWFRYDNCQVKFNLSPALQDKYLWRSKAYTSPFDTITSPVEPPIHAPLSPRHAQSHALFPRITCKFQATDSEPTVLHEGVAVFEDSVVFADAREEETMCLNLEKEFKRQRQGLHHRLGSVDDKHPWPAQSVGYS